MKKATYKVSEESAVSIKLNEVAAGFVAPMTAPAAWAEDAVAAGAAAAVHPAWMTEQGTAALGDIAQAQVAAPAVAAAPSALARWGAPVGAAVVVTGVVAVTGYYAYNRWFKAPATATGAA